MGLHSLYDDLIHSFAVLYNGRMPAGLDGSTRRRLRSSLLMLMKYVSTFVVES